MTAAVVAGERQIGEQFGQTLVEDPELEPAEKTVRTDLAAAQRKLQSMRRGRIT